jgi:hypothetical protein
MTTQDGTSQPAGGYDTTPDVLKPRVGSLDGAPFERSETVATFNSYFDAQRAVDHLSDQRFPVDRVAIVGTDLRLVEKVLGRMTVGRASLAGAGSGAWFGLLIGLLFGIFAVSDWWRVVLAGVIIGAIWGAIFGAIAHAMTGGRRDFTSFSGLQASQYAVIVDVELAQRARELLAGQVLSMNQ